MKPWSEPVIQLVQAESGLREDRAASPPQEPLLKDWPRPASGPRFCPGEQRGYLEPCGCSERQSGAVWPAELTWCISCRIARLDGHRI